MNAKAPIDVTPLEIVTDVRVLHALNAAEPIDFTPLGIAKEVKALQFRNPKQAMFELAATDAHPYEVAIEDGSVTLTSLLHP